jgi:preprotein translocase subunit YajC
MQESTSIRFEPIRHTSVLHPWEVVLALLVFAGLVYFAIWRSRKRSKENGSLHLGGD